MDVCVQLTVAEALKTVDQVQFILNDHLTQPLKTPKNSKKSKINQARTAPAEHKQVSICKKTTYIIPVASLSQRQLAPIQNTIMLPLPIRYKNPQRNDSGVLTAAYVASATHRSSYIAHRQEENPKPRPRIPDRVRRWNAFAICWLPLFFGSQFVAPPVTLLSPCPTGVLRLFRDILRCWMRKWSYKRRVLAWS